MHIVPSYYVPLLVGVRSYRIRRIQPVNGCDRYLRGGCSRSVGVIARWNSASANRSSCVFRHSSEQHAILPGIVADRECTSARALGRVVHIGSSTSGTYYYRDSAQASKRKVAGHLGTDFRWHPLPPLRVSTATQMVARARPTAGGRSGSASAARRCSDRSPVCP